MTSLLESKKLFFNTQHDYRPKLSTETALTIVTNKLYRNMDEKKLSLITLCDPSKAFDSVKIDILMNKLLKVNIDSFWFHV